MLAAEYIMHLVPVLAVGGRATRTECSGSYLYVFMIYFHILYREIIKQARGHVHIKMQTFR